MSILHNQLALHTWTLDTTPLPDALRIAREAGYNAVELRHVDFLRGRKAGLSEDALLQQVRDANIKVEVIGTESGALFATGDDLKGRLDSLRYVSEKAVALGCEVIMLAPGLTATGGLTLARQNLKTCAEITAGYGLKLGLEFNSRHAVINTLAVGMELIDAVNMKNCGILIDTYHLHCGGGNANTFKDVPVEKIITFQCSDAPPGPPSPGPTPVDRLPPGKGAAPLVDIFRNLLAKNYQGYISYEAPNPAQWNRPADVVAREGLELLRGLLTQAEQT